MTWGRRKALKSRQRTNFMNLEAGTPQQRQFFFENLVIPQFPVHGPGCLDSYNFLVSQRLTVILAGDLLEARADRTISKLLQLHHLRSRKFRSKFENIWIVRPPFVKQLPLQTILLYGATTLQIT